MRDFQRDVIDRSRALPVLVDFWAAWCAPCRVLGPVLERMAGESEGLWTLATLDTEEHPSVAADWGVRSIPHVKLFVDGAAVDEFTGALPEYAVRRWLAEAIPGPSAGAVARARELLAAGKDADAASILGGVAEAEPDNLEARILLARSIVLTDAARAASLVRGLEEPRLADELETIATVVRLRAAAGEGGGAEAGTAAAYRDAARAFLAGDYDRALEGFIAIIRDDRWHDDDGARKACLAVFRILGEEHEVTRRRRREFGSALYV